jgi:hypothetical protein
MGVDKGGTFSRAIFSKVKLLSKLLSTFKAELLSYYSSNTVYDTTCFSSVPLLLSNVKNTI